MTAAAARTRKAPDVLLSTMLDSSHATAPQMRRHLKIRTARARRARTMLPALAVGVRLESVSFKNRQTRRRADECQPLPRGLLMSGALDDCPAINSGAILGSRNIHVSDGMSHLLLEYRLRLPDDARVGAALHDPQGRLSVMNVRQHRAAVLHLGLIDLRAQLRSAGFAERLLDLLRNALEFRIRHRQSQSGIG